MKHAASIAVKYLKLSIKINALISSNTASTAQNIFLIIIEKHILII